MPLSANIPDTAAAAAMPPPPLPCDVWQVVYACTEPSDFAGRAAMRATSRLLREACAAVGLAVYGGENAPYVWVKCPEGVGSWEMFDRMLEKANVVITPGAGFGAAGEGYFRISAFNTRENVEEVCRRIPGVV